MKSSKLASSQHPRRCTKSGMRKLGCSAAAKIVLISQEKRRFWWPKVKRSKVNSLKQEKDGAANVCLFPE